MKFTDLTCVRCGRSFAPAITGGTDSTPPSGGVIFHSYGNYGSALYDEALSSDRYIAILVCDGCLAASAAAGNVIRVTPLAWARKPDAVYERWDPDDGRRGEAGGGGDPVAPQP